MEFRRGGVHSGQVETAVVCEWDGMKNFISCAPSPVQLPPFRSLGACRELPSGQRLSLSTGGRVISAWSIPRVHRKKTRFACRACSACSDAARASRHLGKRKSNFLFRRSHIMISQSVPFGTEGAAPIPTADRQSQCRLEHFPSRTITPKKWVRPLRAPGTDR